MIETLRGVTVGIWNTYDEMAPYLLLGLTFAGLLHVLFKKEFILKHLGSNSIGSVIKAAVLGVPLPLCSCGVIPTALSLKKSRASHGAVMSFLISTPQTGVDSIVATWGMLGPLFAVFRPIAAFVMGIGGGVAVFLFGLKRVEAAPRAPTDPVFECVICDIGTPHGHGWGERLRGMIAYAYGTFLDDISLQLIVGIVISGLIGYFVPASFFENYITNDLLGMLLVIMAGIPLYVCATASIPIAMTLMMKGVSPGVAFVFLAVGPATNAATITLVANAMGKKFLAIYLASMITGAVAAGYLLNAVYGAAGMGDPARLLHRHHETGMPFWHALWIGLFSVVLILSLRRKLQPRLIRLLKGVTRSARSRPVTTIDNTMVVPVAGMTCSHCADHVRTAIEALPGVEEVAVRRSEGEVLVKGSVPLEQVRAAVAEAGYRVAD